MLAISLRFLAGRYHATPWGRHVNEADIAWPPDPWRITRALIATWYRKLDHDRFPRERLVDLLSALAAESPVYKLPAAVHAHTRHYMPLLEGGKEKRTLIFDAFARVRPDDLLIVCWRNSELDESSAELLDELLSIMGYMGRAESWVEAQRLVDWVGEPDCYPGDETVDKSTGEFRDVIPLLAPKIPSEYLKFRNQTLVEAQAEAAITAGGRRRARASNPLEFTLPEDWLTAIARDTGDLQKAGWSAPPAANKLLYVRPRDALSPQASVSKIARKRDVTDRSWDTTARFALYGKPLPRLEDAVRVGEWCRLGVMATAKSLFGEDGIPPALSGHDLSENNAHGHAFWLPEDADGDGRIDHVMVHARDGIDERFRRALGHLRFITNRDGEPYTIMLEGIGPAQSFTSQTETTRLAGRCAAWETITPYLHPWHIKKTLTIEDQLRRECRVRELPEIIQLERLPSVRINGRERTPVHFRRFRSKRGLTQPDTHGSFWRIHFAKPVQGPLALGFGCHFGLGLFIPEER